MKPISNLVAQTWATSKRFATMLLYLALLMALSLGGTTSPVVAQDPGPRTTIYLPFIANGGANTPAGPYAQILQMVQQRCSATGLNQVCYVNGQATLQPKSGAVTFSQPGAIADLTNVQSLSLTSAGPDIQTWGMVWLRLRANASAPDQDLTILAFGNVQISSIALFESQASLTDTVTLPSLQFTNSSLVGVTKPGSSGLIVTNPTDAEVLALTLNGAAISLGSTALVEAQPGTQMTVTMATGSSLTDVNGASSIAIQNQQVSVPLNQSGQAVGSPSPARSLTDDELFDQHLHDAFHRIMDRINLANSMLAHLNQAIDRCIAGRSAYVYNVLYWTRVIEATPGLKSLLDPAKLAQAYNRVPNCLSFEVDFDSTVATTHPVLFESSHTHAQGLMVEFSADGGFVSLVNNANLEYPSYVYHPSQSCGPITTQTTPGRLEMADSSLQIAGNKVRFSMVLQIADKPTDTVTIHCPSPAPPIVFHEDHWTTVFYVVHEDLREPDVNSFRFDDWKYTGGEHFSEAIYVRTLIDSGFTFNSTTYLILVHTPVH